MTDLRVNGRAVSVPDGSTVGDIVTSMGYGRARVAVEIDGAICPSSEFGTVVPADGQRVEIVSFVGGG